MLVWRGETLVAPDDPRVTLRTQRTRNVWQLSVANVTRKDAGRWAPAQLQLRAAPASSAPGLSWVLSGCQSIVFHLVQSHAQVMDKIHARVMDKIHVQVTSCPIDGAEPIASIIVLIGQLSYR